MVELLKIGEFSKLSARTSENNRDDFYERMLVTRIRNIKKIIIKMFYTNIVHPLQFCNWGIIYSTYLCPSTFFPDMHLT